MTNLVINNCRYACPASWSELTWRQFRALKNYAALQSSDPEMEEEAAGILDLIAGVDPETACKTDAVQRRTVAACLLERFLGSNAMEGAKKEAERMDGRFEWNGEVLYFPETTFSFDRELIPFAHTTAIEFCEAMDLCLADRWRYAPLIVAVLCRPQGEPYGEKRVIERAWEMADIPMIHVLNLYDQFAQAHLFFKNRYPLCYAKNRGDTSTQIGEPTSWNELLMWVGHFRVHEVERLKQLNCYDFMALVNGKIKTGCVNY